MSRRKLEPEPAPRVMLAPQRPCSYEDLAARSKDVVSAQIEHLNREVRLRQLSPTETTALVMLAKYVADQAEHESQLAAALSDDELLARAQADETHQQSSSTGPETPAPAAPTAMPAGPQ